MLLYALAISFVQQSIKEQLNFIVGKTSNYAVVMAQLIIDGKQLGMAAFMCQLRDLNDHKPMPG